MTIKVSALDGVGQQSGYRAHSLPHKSRALVGGFTHRRPLHSRGPASTWPHLRKPVHDLNSPKLNYRHPPVLEAYHNIQSINSYVVCYIVYSCNTISWRKENGIKQIMRKYFYSSCSIKLSASKWACSVQTHVVHVDVLL